MSSKRKEQRRQEEEQARDPNISPERLLRLLFTEGALENPALDLLALETPALAEQVKVAQKFRLLRIIDDEIGCLGPKQLEALAQRWQERAAALKEPERQQRAGELADLALKYCRTAQTETSPHQRFYALARARLEARFLANCLSGVAPPLSLLEVLIGEVRRLAYGPGGEEES